MYQHFINDGLAEERPCQSQQLEQEGHEKDVFQIFAVFAYYRQEPAETKFPLFFLQFIAPGKEDSLPCPHFQHLFTVGVNGLLGKGGVNDEHIAVFIIGGHDQTVAILHAYEYGKYHLGQVFDRQSLTGFSPEFEVTSRPYKRGVIHAAFFEDIGAF